MGKYFKEDNNKRVSKASLDVEALAEKAIRTAGPITVPPIVKQMAGRAGQGLGKLWNVANPLWQKLIKQTNLENRSQGLIPGELGAYDPFGNAAAIQPGKAPGAYSAGSFMPGAQGVSKLLNKIPGIGPTIGKILSSVDFITAGEKHFPEVGRLLGQRYEVTDLKGGPQSTPKVIKLTLKQILDGIDANGVVTIGERELEFSDQAIQSILGDMKKLDAYAVKWAKIKALAVSMGIGIPQAVIQFESGSPERVKRREESKKAGDKAGVSTYKTPEENKAAVEKAKRDLGIQLNVK